MKDYVPYSWISLSQVKREHYKALAHFYVALGLLEHHGDHFSTRAEELLQVGDNKHSRTGGHFVVYDNLMVMLREFVDQ